MLVSEKGGIYLSEDLAGVLLAASFM